VSALKQTIRSGAMDVCEDLCKRLDEGDADAIALLSKMVALSSPRSLSAHAA